MIGYYIHHHGHGHLHRAQRLVSELDEPVTALSSLPRPLSWRQGWVHLPTVSSDSRTAHQAGGYLHRAPLGDPDLRARMSRIAQWVAQAAPRAMVVDVSVEVTVLARLHGVPVVTIVQPGDRGDAPHLLGHGLSDALVACWPPGFDAMTTGLTSESRARLQCIGAVSRADVDAPMAVATGSVVLLGGTGGGGVTPAEVAALRAAAPERSWHVLGGAHGQWLEDPLPILSSAEVIVTHAGEGAVATVAVARRPAVLIPESRPFDEQYHAARALASSELPVRAAHSYAPDDLLPAIDWARSLDGARWRSWHDGRAAARFADVVGSVALPEVLDGRQERPFGGRG